MLLKLDLQHLHRPSHQFSVSEMFLIVERGLICLPDCIYLYQKYRKTGNIAKLFYSVKFLYLVHFQMLSIPNSIWMQT